jgi:hypothetical protein
MVLVETPTSEAGETVRDMATEFRLSVSLSYLKEPLHAVNSYDMGLSTLLPLRRKSCYRFLSPLNIHRSRPGLNPRNLGPIASTITTRPPRTTGLSLRTCGAITVLYIRLYDVVLSHIRRPSKPYRTWGRREPTYYGWLIVRLWNRPITSSRFNECYYFLKLTFLIRNKKKIRIIVPEYTRYCVPWLKRFFFLKVGWVRPKRGYLPLC